MTTGADNGNEKATDEHEQCSKQKQENDSDPNKEIQRLKAQLEAMQEKLQVVQESEPNDISEKRAEQRREALHKELGEVADLKNKLGAGQSLRPEELMKVGQEILLQQELKELEGGASTKKRTKREVEAPESKSDVNPEEKTPKALGIRDQKKLERKLAWQAKCAARTAEGGEQVGLKTQADEAIQENAKTPTPQKLTSKKEIPQKKTSKKETKMDQQQTQSQESAVKKSRLQTKNNEKNPVQTMKWPERELVELTCSHPAFKSSYNFPREEGWVQTGGNNGVQTLLAIDCEMVQTEESTRALVRVSVVDHNKAIIFNEFVKPEGKVIDYRAEISGIGPADLAPAAHDFESAQAEVVKLLNPGVILIGHGLYHDLEALKIDHKRVIDTALIFKHQGRDNAKPSLAFLSEHVLKTPIRQGNNGRHESAEDAKASMELVLHAIKNGLPGPLEPPKMEVHPDDLKRLLVHRIPSGWPAQCLTLLFAPKHRPIKMDEVKVGSRGLGSSYATFGSEKAANAAFAVLGGNTTACFDAGGREQKNIILPDGVGKISIRKCGPPSECDTAKAPMQ